MGTFTTILILVLYGLLLAAGVYFKSYFDKKGENLATKEDFRDLKAQTAELRQATKEIEAKIDEQVWNKQRQWELKRDTLLETVQSIATLKSANLALIAAAKKDREIGQSESSFWEKKRIEVTDAWEKAQERFERARLMTALLGDEQINDALANLGVSTRQSSKAILQKSPEERFYEAMRRAVAYDHKCITAIRSSLGLPDGDWKDYATISDEVSAASKPD